MKNNLNWNDLLVLTGFLPDKNVNGETTLRVQGEEKTFLDSLLAKTNTNVENDGYRYTFGSTPPKASEWFALFSESTRGMESGSNVTPEHIEFPLNAAVFQFKRLGLQTVESCRGFHNRWQRQGLRNRGPYIKFLTWWDAIAAQTILQNGGYCCLLDSQKCLYINEGVDGILDLGLWLSNIQDIRSHLQPLRTRRERRLLSLLDIPGTTGQEQQVGEHLLSILKNRLDSLWIDEAGNVLGELTISASSNQPPTVLLSAHQDVYDDTGEGKEIIRRKNTLTREGGILGADDRAGIAAIINTLDMLIQHQIGCHLKFAFTTHEEKGQEGAHAIDKSFFEGVDFAISMDRRGETDIVTRTAGCCYCEESQTTFITMASKHLWKDPRYHYKAVCGGISDLMVWSQLGVPSVNLSIGYYNEHRKAELLNLDAWHRAQDLLLEVVSTRTRISNGQR